MNKNAKKWVKALRSGKYAQATGQLKDGNSYCCLGVACDLAVKAGVIKRFQASRGDLPRSVRMWLGLSSPEGQYGGTNLIALNDTHRKTFEEIANVIDRQPEGLFKK